MRKRENMLQDDHNKGGKHGHGCCGGSTKGPGGSKGKPSSSVSQQASKQPDLLRPVVQGRLELVP